jgi:hypothetical protein
MAQPLGAATGYQRSGKNSRVTFGGPLAALAHSKWQATWRGDDLDTTNFESGGKAEGILGIEDIGISFGGDWDARANPYENANAGPSPPGLYPRDDLGNLYFWINKNDNTFWRFPVSRIRSAASGAEVRGKVTFEVSGFSQGGWFPPTGSVS